MEDINTEELPNGPTNHDQNVDARSPVAGILKRNWEQPEQPRLICRIPEVTLTPIDIRAYLKKQNNDVENKPLNGITNCKDTPSVTIHNFQPKEFYIRLKRDNLEALKESLKYSYPMLCCKICNKRYSTTKKLQKHEEAKHMIVMKAQKRVSFSDKVIVHELREYHKCRKCSRIFENYDLLRQHMRKDHRKRKCYICFYCTKSFVDRAFFKLHIKAHCDACGEFFSKRSNYLEHRHKVCKIQKKYKCKTCNETYFHRMDLRDHSFDHLGTFFICDVCKDQFTSKCEVTHHIIYLHSHQIPKDLYEQKGVDAKIKYYCNSCDEISNEKASMKTHTQTLPDLRNEAKSGYGDFYFCKHCLKKFTSNSLLEEHQRVHLKLKPKKHVNSTEIMPLDSNDNDEIKKTFNFKTDLPPLKYPKIVLERLEIPTESSEERNDGYTAPPLFNFELDMPKKAIVDPVKRKTLFSKYRCELCLKHLCNNSSLRRHMQSVHSLSDDLHCSVCEEQFANRVLLKRHRCIRQHIPETTFDDARPEIYFDNLMLLCPDAMDCAVPAPLVEFTEYDAGRPSTFCNKSVFNGYSINVQEVPIEF